MEFPTLTADQAEAFARDGFLVLERFIDPAWAEHLATRFEPLFAGRFETGLMPDEWNWRSDRDPADRARQICNGWRADRAIAGLVLQPGIGWLAAGLAGWPGARIAQDNVIWKPPGATPLGFHQDNSYNGWIVPSEMLSCWVALDPTSAAGGTIEYVRGSHRWGRFPPATEFHAPADYRRDLAAAAATVGQTPEIVAVEVPAGGCAFHHGWVWHGSDANRDRRPRRSLVAHCMSSAARFHPTMKSAVYSRYQRVGDDSMDESFFPVLWRNDGYRTPWLDGYMQGE
jgi:hypothetical protein